MLAEVSNRDEYGNADDPAQFEAVLEYSPLQNIMRPNGTQQYPAMIISAGALCATYVIRNG